MCAESREKPTRPVPIGQWAALVVSFPFPSVKISNMAATVTALPTLLNVSNINGEKKNKKKIHSHLSQLSNYFRIYIFYYFKINSWCLSVGDRDVGTRVPLLCWWSHYLRAACIMQENTELKFQSSIRKTLFLTEPDELARWEWLKHINWL